MNEIGFWEMPFCLSSICSCQIRPLGRSTSKFRFSKPESIDVLYLRIRPRTRFKNRTSESEKTNAIRSRPICFLFSWRCFVGFRSFISAPCLHTNYLYNIVLLLLPTKFETIKHDPCPDLEFVWHFPAHA